MTPFFISSLFMLLLGAITLATGHAGVMAAFLAVFTITAGIGVANPRWQYFGPYVCRGKNRERRVALTFDDGPDARSTPALLDLLNEAKVKATFFCVGKKVLAENELAARIVREGHLLENHSHLHSNWTNFFLPGFLRKELTRAQNAIEKATGQAPRMFRPPMGLSNPSVFIAARTMGLTVVGWTARGLDTVVHDPQRIVARILRNLEPGGIILLHDGGIPPDRLTNTVRILLDNLRAQGYEVIRLDQLL